MRLNAPVRTLFDYPIDEILAELPAELDPVWDLFPFRQERFGVHGATRSIVFKWAVVPAQGPHAVMTSSYAPQRLADAVAACGDRVAQVYSGEVVSLLLAELRAGGEIPKHRDSGAMLEETHRCHLPIMTSPDVTFLIEEAPYYLRAGTVYELDNMRSHAVRNAGPSRRVHVICNIQPEPDRAPG